MLPIYPMDGGQILRALLWFVMGPARSLLVASLLGIAGALIGFALLFAILTGEGRFWLGIMALFAITQSWQGLTRARLMSKLLALPKHPNRHCPSCKQSPPAVPMWGCRCGNATDIFAADGICPNCGTQFELVPCPFCGVVRPFGEWIGPAIGTPIAPPPVPVGTDVSPAPRT